jgi:septum formation protein
MRLVLGSSSSYRKQILRDMGYDFEVVSPEVDESRIRAHDPQDLALLLARTKAAAVAAKLSEPALVIAADQVVAQGDEIRGKPGSEAEARRFLRSAAEAPSRTVSAVVALNTLTGRQADGIDVVWIHLRSLPDELIEERIADGEIFYCAGALRLEDPVIAPYIERIDGALDSVMGLPRELTARLIQAVS